MNQADQQKMMQPFNCYVIGCGGVGYPLIQCLSRLVNPSTIVAIDRDGIEPRNLDRQLFNESHLGFNKAEVMSQLFGVRAIAEWFSVNSDYRMTKHDIIFSLVDNHPSRLSALQYADRVGCAVITAGNEVLSSEAFIYYPTWKESRLDPRTYYPEITTNHDDDPRAASIGCVGDAQKENRQLASANMMAAALAIHLFVVWKLNNPEDSIKEFLPYKLSCAMSKMSSEARGIV